MPQLNLFCFREKYYRYFCCIPIQVALGIAVFIALGTQYYVSIFFLTQHVWYWFIALVVAIAAHALLFWAIYTKKAILFYPLMIYQVLFILLMIGAVVWMIFDLCNPWQSWIFSYCDKNFVKTDYYQDPVDCISKTRMLAGINLGIFIICGVLNVFVLDVFFRFRIYVETGTMRTPTVHVVDQSVGSHPASVNLRPTYSDPTRNIIYSPGNVYQPQAVYSPPPSQPIPSPPPPQPIPSPPPPQQDHNPGYQPYPTVRGPTAPVYQVSPSRNTNLEQMFDAPPAYSQAVQDKY